MNTKKVPLRKCVACREMKPKKELLRIVKTSDNKFYVDKTGKLSGRGAYICNSKDCFMKAKKNKSLEHAFECAITDDIYEDLLKVINDEE